MRSRSLLLFMLLWSSFLLVVNVSAAPAAVDIAAGDTSARSGTNVSKAVEKAANAGPDINKTLKIRAISSKALDYYGSRPEFRYEDGQLAEGQSWWSRFWSWFWYWIRSLFGEQDDDETSTSSGGAYLVIAVIVFLIVYLTVKYMHLENIFRKKPDEAVVPYTESLKNIHEISFDQQIKEAVDKRNYKIAVRLHYLSVLKKLSDVGQIAWQPDKPNSVYLQEIRDPGYKEQFGQLTRQFEYVWYGDFPLGEQAFGNIDRLFGDFKKTLR